MTKAILLALLLAGCGAAQADSGWTDAEFRAARDAETASEHLGTCKVDADECAACRAYRLAPKVTIETADGPVTMTLDEFRADGWRLISDDSCGSYAGDCR